MKTGLTVIAYVTAKPGYEEQVLQSLLDLVSKTRREKGCINYDLHQSQESARKFAIYENWENPSDLNAHAKSAHLAAFSKLVRDQLERPAEIRKWSMISELNEKP
jgi:quinol monooxygenase YgiN